MSWLDTISEIASTVSEVIENIQDAMDGDDEQ